MTEKEAIELLKGMQSPLEDYAEEVERYKEYIREVIKENE